MSDSEGSVYVEMQPAEHCEGCEGGSTPGTKPLVRSKQKGGEKKEGSPCSRREEEWGAVEQIPVEHLNVRCITVDHMT